MSCGILVLWWERGVVRTYGQREASAARRRPYWTTAHMGMLTLAAPPADNMLVMVGTTARPLEIEFGGGAPPLEVDVGALPLEVDVRGARRPARRGGRD